MVKLGGSLLHDIPSVVAFLEKLAVGRPDAVVTVGTGTLGDAVCEWIDGMGVVLSVGDYSRLVTRVQEIVFYSLSSRCPFLRLCAARSEVEVAHAHGFLPMVSDGGIAEQIAAESCQGTDTRALLLAGHLTCEALHIVTDVPGVFDRDPADAQAHLLSQVKIRELGALRPKCIDAGIALHPERLGSLFVTVSDMHGFWTSKWTRVLP